jgi:glycosyltransferase involved in cell wall biosynthesis
VDFSEMNKELALLDRQEISISIITIVRNGAEFIRDTIESVLSQTYTNIEYILIDGLSTDGTVEIIQSNESKIAYWKSEKDEGIADAFNKGFAASTGDYILYLNADDKLAHANVVSDMVKGIHEYNFPTLIYGDIDYIDRHSGQLIRHASIPFSSAGFLKGRMFPHPSLFTHRRYFEKYGVFDTAFKITMDYEWLLRGVLIEKVVHIPILVTCFRDGGISTVNNQRVKNETILALKKNGFIRSRFAEARLRAYFYIRTSVKLCLVGLRYSLNLSSSVDKSV